MGVGLGITVGLLAFSTLALFVTTFLFMAQKQNAEKELATLRESTKEIATDSERNTDSLRTLINDAKPESLASYFVKQTAALSERTAGAGKETPKGLVELITKRLEGTNASSLGALIDDYAAKIAALERQVAEADAARQRALADLQNEVALTKKQKDDFDAAMAAVTGDINKYKDAADQLRTRVNELTSAIQGQVAEMRGQFEDQIGELNSRLTRSGDDLLKAQEKIRELVSKLSGQTYKPGDEAALVDGEVIGLDPVEDNVFINRGRNQKVVLGLTFEVYANASAIRPDGTGDYPRGKATVEVIKIDDNSSVARVIRNPRGNPVVKGDVIANVVYDPKKSYKFMIYGHFDTNRDGRSTPEEQADIRAIIEEWGGAVVDSLGGDVDFLVLGAKPIAPPQPPATAPPEIVRQYLAERRKVAEYDAIVQQAVATSIPVLNQNRLYTLTGK